MKVLVTHINPHLDDIFAIWLYKHLFRSRSEDSIALAQRSLPAAGAERKKFHPEEEYRLEFLSAKANSVTWEGKPVDEDPNVIHFGIGRGKYDEHKGDINECAGSLVWKDFKVKGLIPKDELEVKALEEMVEWNKQIDLGKSPIHEYSPFSVQSFIRSLDSNPESSLKSYQLGEEILDRIFANLKDRQRSLKDWQKRVEFESSFGKTIAVSSQTIDRAFCKEMGGDLFLIYDPGRRDVQYFTPRFDVDLEPIFKKVKSIDPEADWFLHQSHHMVICGSGSAPDSKRTKLSFEELIEAVKSIND